MGMHADGGENTFVPLGDFHRQAIILDRSDRTYRNDLCDAGGGCALDHGLDVVTEFRVSEMAMRIDDRCHWGEAVFSMQGTSLGAVVQRGRILNRARLFSREIQDSSPF